MIIKNRIKKHSEFQKVIGEGDVKKTLFFVAYISNNDLGYTRIGISVPKKTGNAVIRNKIKRQIRACIASCCNYSKSKDYVLIVRRAYDINNFNKIKTEISEIL